MEISIGGGIAMGVGILSIVLGLLRFSSNGKRTIHVDARLPECREAFDNIDKNVALIRKDVSKTFDKIDKKIGELDIYLRGNGRKK